MFFILCDIRNSDASTVPDQKSIGQVQNTDFHSSQCSVPDPLHCGMDADQRISTTDLQIWLFSSVTFKMPKKKFC
jgi:hypothetical protein